jgi:Tol biopolymer transport system component
MNNKRVKVILSLEFHSCSDESVRNPLSPIILFSQPDPADCLTDTITASPNGRYIAIEYNCEADLFVRILDWFNLNAPPIMGARGYFMDWSPAGNWFLFRQTDERQVWLIAADGSTQTLLPLPSGTYEATFSPDGHRITFVTSTSLGEGSQLGMFDLLDNSQIIQHSFPGQVVASPRWSPSGEQLAYILMGDNNIPYTVGELWLAGNNGQPLTLLAEVDAGHGYPAVWSAGGSHLTYIKRENPDSLLATYQPVALRSNLYQVAISTTAVISLTEFSDSLVYDISWSPDGSQIAFTANDAVWLAQPGQPPVQVSDPGIVARHPIWLISPTP